MCTKELRILILNAIQNIDEDFFEYKAFEKAETGVFPVSDKIIAFFKKPGAESTFMQYLQKLNGQIDYSVIFRTYSVSRVRNIRYIEPWQWRMLPFINYKSSIKDETLKFIQKSSGIDRLKLSL